MDGMTELLREALTEPAFQQYLKEATETVEQELSNEDAGWLNFSNNDRGGVSDNARIVAVRKSRAYFYTDPMAKQAIRLWTDYTFGEGMSLSAGEEVAQKVLDLFWGDPQNQPILGTRGQRKNSDKVLTDGEIFFAVFLGGGGKATIRTIDPLEITEIVTDVEDVEAPMFYKREWTTTTGQARTSYYRSHMNIKGVATQNSAGQSIQQTEDAIVYHLPINTIGQRGTPLLLPAQFWLKYQKKFLAARISIMLALTRFAWKVKVKGGATAVAGVKSTVNGQTPEAGGVEFENEAADMQPIKTETGAKNAYDDGRMIKLQICSSVGWPEQYFGDLATGNLATAKTVELPVAKMCGSYQKLWADAYRDICEIVMENAGIDRSKMYIDFDFPAISPKDDVALAQILQTACTVFPEFADSDDIKTAALVAMGINDPSEVLDELEKIKKAKDAERAKNPPPTPPVTPPVPGQPTPPAQPGQAAPAAPGAPATPEEATAILITALRAYRESIEGNGHNHNHELVNTEKEV